MTTTMRWRLTAVKYRLLWPRGSRRLELLAAHRRGVAVVEIEVVVATEAVEAVAEEAVETEAVVVVVLVV
jgi:hypothetical protein